MKKIQYIFLVIILLVSSACFYACNPDQQESLDDYKNWAKGQITLYAQQSENNDESSDLVIEALNDGILLIDLATNKEEVDIAIEQAKSKIDSAVAEESPEESPGESPEESPEGAKTISFVNESYTNKVTNEIGGNFIIRSYSELQTFFANNNVVENNEFIFEKFNEEFFNQNALVFCFYWLTDSRIQRQITNVYVEGEKVLVEILNTFPADIEIGEDGSVAINTECYFNFNILQVQKADVNNVTEATIVHIFEIANKI